MDIFVNLSELASIVIVSSLIMLPIFLVALAIDLVAKRVKRLTDED